MSHRIERIVIAVIFALLTAGLTLIAVQAQQPPAAEAPRHAAADSPCTACHQEIQVAWSVGAHGQALSDPLFEESWASQGKPGACLVCHTTGYDPATGEAKAEGVTCEACHGELTSDHPGQPMPTDTSPALCGRCHSDTRFDWSNWQGSAHYQRGMNCTVCHDPHSASLKTIKNQAATEDYADASPLCINCHKEVSMDFPYSEHHQKGVSCVQCHVKHIENQEKSEHSIPDHSFQANIASCNTCHSHQMHGATASAIMPTDGTAPAEGTATAQPKPVPTKAVEKDAPSPVSPVGYAGLAGLAGLAAGMVLAPWLERFYHKMSRSHSTRHTDEKE
ncbi:MAG: hypothetical protein JETCAE02_23110 [Anaerolineaceae bacterium]|jgi:predicted CXXCH cytochrome family protein|nr:hypothetical protein [Anaerolineae bacterium]MCL4823618.1 hypothetical protein [Anaerolineales bacterium]MDL1925894.1 hypothetical protein [Anaerolineae bacterium AMX1]GER79745.1 conserved hypothetical protein [Candidatus Denitrolinea symbiosum]GIK09712.1 MAG: hypothetical protein BroJett001_17780 [Chloroflexota bacterium]GJQ39899.1 MAG: hypothetical protein JETCAE02_23110 [Anaerolineaceae bacterium]